MSLRGKVNPDQIPANKYRLAFIGVPPVTFTAVGGLEQEIPVIELPDRQRVTGGQTSGTELTVTVPLHHNADINFMELWFREGQDPVTPTYRKIGTMTYESGTGEVLRTYVLQWVWINKRELPEAGMEEDGEMQAATYTLQVDDLIPIP